MQNIDEEFENLTESQKNDVIQFTSIVNIDDVKIALMYLSMANFNLNVKILSK